MFALVTGSSGFLGSHLVERLRATGHRVRGLIRDPRKGDLLTKQGAEVAIGDLNSAESLVKAVEGVDVVFHAAAMVESWGRWSDYLATTVQGTKDLLKAAVEAKVQHRAHQHHPRLRRPLLPPPTLCKGRYAIRKTRLSSFRFLRARQGPGRACSLGSTKPTASHDIASCVDLRSKG